MRALELVSDYGPEDRVDDFITHDAWLHHRSDAPEAPRATAADRRRVGERLRTPRPVTTAGPA
ncbi:MAG: hypothetical protein OXC25_12640, partial [Thiotrichales bacterium]|nr:hypothetical protein [Thiotrichales bacterium]